MSSGQGKAVARTANLTARIWRVIHCAWSGEKYTVPNEPELSPMAMDPIARLLGHVWFAMLVGWKGGLYTTEQVVAEMRATAELAIR